MTTVPVDKCCCFVIDPLAVNGVKDMANRNKDKESKETTKIGKRRPPKITLPSR